MAKVKMMDEKAFSSLVKELSSQGELIKARQKEKQALIDQFEKERTRYKSGKISEAALRSSIQKTNKELLRLDKEIRLSIDKLAKLSARSTDFARRQKPKVVRASERGVAAPKKPKKKAKSSKKAKPKAKPKKKAKAKPKPKAKKVKPKAKPSKKAKPKAKPKPKAKSKAKK